MSGVVIRRERVEDTGVHRDDFHVEVEVMVWLCCWKPREPGDWWA